jgi:hypothetical protein
MAKQTLLTRALLACGVVAGPMYVMVAMAQALTRDGFDLRQHRFSWLTAGDLGWIQKSNMVLVGVLTVLFAVGVRQVLPTGRGTVWGPRLLVLFGVAYVIGGLLTADPVAGFPPGTTPEMVHTTWRGTVQNASRGISTLSLIAANLAIAMWFAADGRRNWALFYGAGFPVVLAALTAVGFVAIRNRSAFAVAILATPWILVTALAVHLYQRDANQGNDIPAGLAMRRPVSSTLRPRDGTNPLLSELAELRRSMKRTFVLTLIVLAAAALFAGLVHAVLVAAHVSEPAATTVYGLTPRRLWATMVDVLALVGVVIGGLALARPATRFGIAFGRLGAIVALVAGLIAVVNGGLVLAVATGGPGTGNGVVGGAAALVLGLIATVLGGLAVARSRRIASGPVT